jgi:hypothetical protein
VFFQIGKTRFSHLWSSVQSWHKHFNSNVRRFLYTTLIVFRFRATTRFRALATTKNDNVLVIDPMSCFSRSEKHGFLTFGVVFRGVINSSGIYISTVQCAVSSTPLCDRAFVRRMEIPVILKRNITRYIVLSYIRRNSVLAKNCTH